MWLRLLYTALQTDSACPPPSARHFLALQPRSPHPELVYRVILSQTQRSPSFAFTQLHDVSVCHFLQHAQAPLTSSSALWCFDHSPRLFIFFSTDLLKLNCIPSSRGLVTAFNNFGCYINPCGMPLSDCANSMAAA